MPSEIDMKDYISALVETLRRDQELIRIELKAAGERLGLSLEKLEVAVLARTDNHEKRITVLERAWANYQGRFWALGVGLGVVIIVADYVFKRLM